MGVNRNQSAKKDTEATESNFVWIWTSALPECTSATPLQCARTTWAHIDASADEDSSTPEWPTRENAKVNQTILDFVSW